jgi:hypothetical protein
MIRLAASRRRALAYGSRLNEEPERKNAHSR